MALAVGERDRDPYAGDRQHRIDEQRLDAVHVLFATSPSRACQRCQMVLRRRDDRVPGAERRAPPRGGCCVWSSKGWRSNLITLIVIGAVASALRRAAASPGTQVRKVRSSPTAVGDTMIVATVLRDSLRSLAGPRPRAASRAAALIAFAVLANSIRPIRPAVRGAITEVRRARDAIGRYGVDGTGVTAVADRARSPSGAGSNR